MSEAAKKIKTIFCDIDGCILRHDAMVFPDNDLIPKDLLPGVQEVFADWREKGYRVVLITGRPPSSFEMTKEQLSKFGLYYDDIIMGLPRGMRVVINDMKPGSIEPTASGLSLERNEGMSNVDI